MSASDWQMWPQPSLRKPLKVWAWAADTCSMSAARALVIAALVIACSAGTLGQLVGFGSVEAANTGEPTQATECLQYERTADGTMACAPDVYGKADERRAMRDYDRSAFGSGWTDADRDCLDTRAEVLVRDGAGVQVADCRVVAGSWVDPYTGAVETDPGRVHVDHVLALAEAWRQGADTWSDEQRRAFANDPANLQALSGSVNMRKSDQDGAQWCRYQEGERTRVECPATGSRDAFDQRYAQVAAAYGLG